MCRWYWRWPACWRSRIIPLAEYISNSVRVWRTEFDFISHSSFPVKETLNFFVPNLFGNFVDGTYVSQIIGPDGQTWILSPYLGFLPLMLAWFGLRVRSRRTWFYLFTGIFFLFLAFGHHTFLYRILFHLLPFLAAIRYPVKFLFFPTFAAAVLAGWGMETLASRASLKVAGFVSALIALAAAAWLALRFFFRNVHDLISAPLHLTDYYKFVLSELLGTVHGELLVILLILCAAAVLLCLFCYRKIGASVLEWGILLLIVADLFAFNFNINPPVSAELFSYQPENVRNLDADRSLFRYYVNYQVYEKSGSFFGSQDGHPVQPEV